METKIIDGLIQGYVDETHPYIEGYEPQLIVNEHTQALKVLSVYQKCLLGCDSFQMAIAFLSDSGLQALLATFLECERRGIQGQIIISAYLHFTSPSAIRKLSTFSNVSIRLNTVDAMHMKGTLFHYEDHQKLLIGSSNLTQESLSVNTEWNVLLHSTYQGKLCKEVMHDFARLWERSEVVDEDVLAAYEAKVKRQSHQYALMEHQTYYQYGVIQPNAMQIKALAALKEARENQHKKSLLISATGTGKTLLAAFDVAYHQPQRLLFVAHREQLLDQAIKAFKRVCKHARHYGKLSGTHKELHCDYVFATIQSLSQTEIMQSFAQDHFDMVIIDEAHRVGGLTYQKLMRFFTPAFMLGLSATPERMDGFNVYEAFDYHVAYEIRLHEAMKADMLVPFHYYGIKDVSINGQLVHDFTHINILVSEDRVNHVIRQINLYEVRDVKRKGLIFVSRVQEAIELNRLFNIFGRIYNLKSEVISGSDDASRKDELIRSLQSDGSGTINYLFSVDVLNEGVDIPSLNQIIMLRPTQSAIIFVQQLGRGLRKALAKEYVLVLDFIGNYANNFHIPLALSHDRTYQKENLRRFVHEGTKLIYGPSTINLERIVKDNIFAALDKVKFNQRKFLLTQYENIAHKLHRIPTLLDFMLQEALDPTLFFTNKEYQSYHYFLEKENILQFNFTDRQWSTIAFVSRFVGFGKRPHEAITLDVCLNPASSHREQQLSQRLQQYGIILQDGDVINIKHILSNTWLRGTGRHAYEGVTVLDSQATHLTLSSSFLEDLRTPLFKAVINEIIECSLFRYEHLFHSEYPNSNFKLYQSYTMKDVMHLAGWKEMVIEQNVGGYFMHHETQTLPLFVNYHKEVDIQSSIQYHDHFTSHSSMTWISKSNRNLASKEIQSILTHCASYKVMLFVRKKVKDDKHFLYLGEVSLMKEPKEIRLSNGKSSAVEFTLALKHSIRDDIYDYIVNT